MSEIRLSVVIPAYNEESRLPKTLEAVDDYLQKQSYTYEIVVMNSGSTDKTEATVQFAASRIKNLRLVTIENRGKGYAVKQGVLRAKGAFRIFMDADNATTIDHVEKMWPEFEKGFEVVIGSRDIKGAVIAVPQPWWRRRLGDVFNLIVQLLSGLRGIWDTQCGFKGFSAKAAQKIFPLVTIDGWAFDVEVLILARKRGYRIKEIPVRWINDPQSKVKLKGMIQMLFEVFRIKINGMRRTYG